MRQNEREVPFNVDAYTAKLIGRENVSKLEGAVLEIVKNAYDADARIFCLYYNNVQDCIYIMDNGIGMKEQVLREHWMTIGNSSKKKTYRTGRKRIQTGAKGIGRFALDRISDSCEMLTISEEGGLEWQVNWADFDDNKNLSDVKAKLYDSDESLKGFVHIDSWTNRQVAELVRDLDFEDTGTVFCLKGLHDIWDKDTCDNLKNHLENLLPPDVVRDFDIYFFDDNTGADEAKIVSANLDSYDYKVEFEVIDDSLNINIDRNEFDFGQDEKRILDEAGVPEEERPYFHGEIKEITYSFAEIKEKKNIIGNYKGILYFNKVIVSKDDTEKFYYKDITGRKKYTKEFGGIKLYRDHFRVRPYGEYGDNDFDWLELSARRNASPAGLGHPRSNWRVGSEQMTGLIDISRENTNLEDAANRNGIQEGPGLEQLKRVIISVIAELETDRQAIGRKLAAYKKQQDELQAEIERINELAEARKRWEEEQKEKKKEENNTKADDVNVDESSNESEENPENLPPTMNPEEAANAIKELEKRQEQEIQELQDEIKMLETLATTGIITNMFMHEIRTLTNNIGQELDSAYEAIKYDKDIEEAFKNVQRAIVFKKHFASWFGVTIESIRKDKRKRKTYNIKDMLDEFLNNWKNILEKDAVELQIACDENIRFKCFAFDIENVISNLISNSLFSFDRENDSVLDEKKIKIAIKGVDNGFILDYQDTGWGLQPRYRKNPDLITKAFESDRGKLSNSVDEDGTGMGMWIVKRTVMEYDGDIDLSENKTLAIGFRTKISFGGKYV